MTDLTIITDTSQIPAFESEAEEVALWNTHALAEHLLKPEHKEADFLPPPRPRKSTPTSIRLGTDLEQRLRVLAERKNTTYQTLLKEFVLERVYEEEKRLKII